MELEKINITSENSYLVNEFLTNAGKSLEDFRYFSKRPVTIIENHICTIVLIKNNKPVGYAHLDKEAGKVWLGIAVVESEKGKGYGKLMMQELITQAKEKNLSHIYLTVDSTNIHAIKMYEAFGFRLISKTEDRLLYKLEIRE